MKRHITPTSVERVMRDDDFIVSMTDPKGIITYCNRIFIEFSGYSETELLGSQHNIIRHPDMPRAVFKLLWDKIQNREECFAYVKNMSKDGGFYWVFTNVTPVFDPAGNISGYFSVRRKPKQSGVQTASAVYAAMLEAEKKAGAANAIAAATKVLVDILNEKGLSYDELVLAI
ncbi:PAS domain-containing protein [Sideroxydans lithotrophicus]|uniref:Putative PAS/PAC sensor protein n=1 Tax=Sideroxydans lithotrophicus (strain ES-1) TaxID=580332 RepID=D5CMD5_SIDLE|nr:PAS domain-containing protein [Sideroxydans lithotrophicus]ADE12607.1 putative PAS/PAC sensor protein [Sideroxydans lithotrophicus ES-1]